MGRPCTGAHSIVNRPYKQEAKQEHQRRREREDDKRHTGKGRGETRPDKQHKAEHQQINRKRWRKRGSTHLYRDTNPDMATDRDTDIDAFSQTHEAEDEEGAKFAFTCAFILKSRVRFRFFHKEVHIQ